MDDIAEAINFPARRAASDATLSMGDDPEKAAKSLQLSNVTGVPAPIIHNDFDNFSRETSADFANRIVKNNPHLQDYINSHPLAAKVSNDDWGQLDVVSEHLKPLGNLTAAGTLKNFVHGFEEGEGPGGIGEWLRSQPGGKEFAQQYPYSAAAWYALGAPIEIPLRLTSGLMHGGAEAVAGWIEGATGIEKDTAKSAMLSAADIYFMGRMSGNIHPTPGVSQIKAHNEGLKQAATKAFTDHLDEVEGLIKPYIDSGEPIPAGLHPAIDKVLVEQAKLDAKAADDAFSESQKASTRERSPELFQNFIRQHTDAKIGISAEKIRELYGDKEPNPNDNILGWIPDIADRLRTAEATGGHVEAPWAETLARMDPEVWKELHDDMQFRPGGVTINEGKELDKGPDGAVVGLENGIRAQAGIDPVFAEDGIQNLRIKKVKANLLDEYKEAGGSHTFAITDQVGRDVGQLMLTERYEGKDLYVEWVGGQAGAQAFGPRLIRGLAEEIQRQFPNAEFISGHRVSGAREKAGTEKTKGMVRVPLKALLEEAPEGWLKADAGQSYMEQMQELFGGKWQDLDKNTKALVPTEAWDENKVQLIDAIDKVLAKMLPKHKPENTQFAEALTHKGKGVQGFYQEYSNSEPIIAIALGGKDPVGVGAHEGIHWLRRNGFFTDAAWKTLSKAAIEGDWLNKPQENLGGQSIATHSGYRKGTPELQLEEAIAHEYPEWLKEQSKDHPAATIFEKMKELFDEIKRAIKEILGFEPTYEDLFKKVESGEIGSREGTQPRDPRAFRAAEQPELPGMTRQEDLDLFKPNSLGIDAKHYNKMMKTIEKLNAEAELHQMERALKEEKKRQSKEWKDNEAEVRKQVAVDIEQRPDISVARFFGEGMLYGEKLDKRPKLDEAKLTPEQKAGVDERIFSDRGSDPDDVAGLFGYQSGDLLVDALARQKEDRGELSLNKFIEAEVDKETQKRMEKQFGKLDENILQEARDQVLSQTQMDLLHEETVAAGMRIGSEMPFTKQDAAAWVKESFKGLKASEVSGRKFLEQSGRLGRQIEKAHIDGDLTLAFQLMQKREFAALMAKEAIKFEKEKAQFERTAKRSERQVISGVDQEYTNFVHDILMRVGRPPKRSVQNLQEDIQQKGYPDLLSFVRAKEVETFGLDEIPVADFLFDPNFRKPVEEMTTEEFRGAKQSVDTLLKHGRDVKKIIVAGESADLDVVKAEMKEKLQTFPEKEYPATKGRIEKLLDLPKSWLANSINMETLLNRWDRNDPRGVFNKYLVRPLTEAANYKAKLDRKYSAPYKALGKIENQTKLMESPFIDPLSGRKFSGFTKGNAMAILQNAGNISNWKTLTKGYNVDPGMLKQWLFDNTTKKDWDRAQAMGDIFGDIFAEAETVYRNITGVAPEKVELQPIETPFGTYKGWYHPLIKDSIREGKSKAQRGGDVYDNSDYGHASVANGYTKRRTGAVYPLDLNFDMVPVRMSQMLHDIAFRQVVIETQKIFNDRGFREQVTKHYGDQYKDGLMDYLRGVAGNASVNSKAASEAMRLSEFLRQNVISTYIGFNPYTALKHGPTALALSAKEVGAGNFARAVVSLYGRSEDIGLSNSEFAMKNSEELQRRERHWQETVVGQHKDLYGKSTLRESVIEKGSWLVAQSDMMSAKPTWLAQYWKSVEDGVDKGQAVFEADRAVRRAHGSTAITNQPALVRGGGGGAMHGWLTSIYGFFGTMMQRRVELAHQMADTYDLGRQGELKQAAGNVPAIAAGVFAYVIWPTIVEEWVTSLTTDDKRGWGQHVFTASMAGLASSMLYVRDIIHGLTTGQEPSVGLLTSPLHDLKRLTDDLKQGKKMFDKQHAGRMVGDTITVFGELTGLAPKAIGNAAKFGIDVASGKERPKTITDWRMGVTRGTAKKRVEK